MYLREGVIFYLERDIQVFNKISLVIHWMGQLAYIYPISRSRVVY